MSFFGPLRGAVEGLFAEGVYGFFIQPMYDMNFMTSTADRSSPVNKQ
jgi:hypothetical protein